MINFIITCWLDNNIKIRNNWFWLTCEHDEITYRWLLSIEFIILYHFIHIFFFHNSINSYLHSCLITLCTIDSYSTISEFNCPHLKSKTPKGGMYSDLIRDYSCVGLGRDFCEIWNFLNHFMIFSFEIYEMSIEKKFNFIDFEIYLLLNIWNFLQIFFEFHRCLSSNLFLHCTRYKWGFIANKSITKLITISRVESTWLHQKTSICFYTIFLTVLESKTREFSKNFTLIRITGFFNHN